MEVVRSHARLAELLAASQQHERAVAHYERALQHLQAVEAAGAGDCSGTRRWCGVARRQLQLRLTQSLAVLKRHQEAIDMLEEVVRQDATNIPALVNLSALLMMTEGGDRLHDAERLCARALALQPDFSEAHYNLNVVLRRLGRQREAIDTYWRLLQRNHGLRRPVVSNSNNGSEHRVDAWQEPESAAVICVKWGCKYDSEYVNKLFRGLAQNCSNVNVDVICLTDDPEGIEQHDSIHVLQLEGGWNGWWNKAQVFAPHVIMKVAELKHHRCAYIDLDTVIIGDVSNLLLGEFGDKLAVLHTDEMTNEQRKDGFNSSIMLWTVEHAPHLAETIYEPLKEHFDAVQRYIYKFDHWLEMAIPQAALIQNSLPAQIVEYCSLEQDVVGSRIVPKSARVVCFPLHPKPHEATDAWIQDHWS